MNIKNYIFLIFTISILSFSLCISGCCGSKEVESEKKIDIEKIAKEAKAEAEKTITESNAEETAENLMKEIINDKE
ncbi:hypothetical protein KAJ27_20900 [bacterium]|nr:hypothetical protein [bacterium]